MAENRESLTLDQQYVLKRIYKRKKRKKSRAYLLWLFTGLLGGHRYYLKHYKSAILMSLIFAAAVAVGWFTWYLLLVINACWAIHDVFFISKWCSTVNEQIHQKVISDLIKSSQTTGGQINAGNS